ncbi:MAG: leucine-rich repeat protein, partial [Oscillospiraceae bacterium]|nr:leucine-rich repeat protein [Oscillospiraceae bacterium]
IGYSALFVCSSLTAITIPNSVTSIDSQAFSGCSSLTAITIPDSVKSIGSSAFQGCSSVTEITIPDSVTFIGSSAFKGCSSLTAITIPDGVTRIGPYTFKGCSNLKNLTILNPDCKINDSADTIPAETVIHGYAGSTAEAYAQKYGCSFVELVKINAQPENYSGMIGETAEFTVEAAGENLSYQWQFLSNTGWEDSGMEDAKTPQLHIPVTAERDGQQYRCIVKSADGFTAVSESAALTVSTKITAQPTAQTGAIDSTVRFTVAASGTGTLSYQWQFKSSTGWKDSGMTGANTATLSVPVTAARDGQEYRCIVKSSNGTSDISSPASIQVKAAVTAQPTVQTLELNQTAKFTVAATGTNLMYQWQFLDVNTWKNSGMTGSNTATLSVPVTAARDGQQYRCIVKSSNGTSDISSPASIKVKTAITAQPTNQTGKIDSTVKFTVAASGTNLKYQWQFLSTSGWKNSGMTGANTATLSVPVTAARDGQQYKCVVTSANGTSATTNAVKLIAGVKITAHPKDYTGNVGTDAKFTVSAAGNNLSYQWQFNDNGVWKDSGMTGAKTATLVVPITAARNGQKYRCVVKSANGTSDTSDAAALKAVAYNITGQPQNVTAKVGETAKFTVTASNAAYQWQFLSTSGWQNSGMTGAQTAAISVPVTEARDGQKYRCVVKFADGTTKTSSEVSLKVQAAITAQPQNASGKVGATAKFSVAATGTNLTYQWQFLSTSGWQNSGMTGAKTATISVPITDARNGQQYRCIVTSGNGTNATSNAAKLTVTK